MPQNPMRSFGHAVYMHTAIQILCAQSVQAAAVTCNGDMCRPEGVGFAVLLPQNG